jgi:hypothetical protein
MILEFKNLIKEKLIYDRRKQMTDFQYYVQQNHL